MSSVKKMYPRLPSDDSDSYYDRTVDEYNENEDQQQLLPPPPEESQNGTINYLVKKFGWYALCCMFPYIFAPIIFLRNFYSRSKRVYMASQYAHNEGYTQYLWTLLPMGLTKVVIWSVWIVSGGKYDLTEFFESGPGSKFTQHKYNLRSRNRDTEDDDDNVSRDSFQQQYSSKQRLLPEEDDNSSIGSGIFSGVSRIWKLVKMCVDVVFLGLYAAFGWTFGRLVEEDGQLKKKKRGRPSRNSSVRSANGDIAEEKSKSSKWPWIILTCLLLYMLYNTYSKYHNDHRNSTSY